MVSVSVLRRAVVKGLEEESGEKGGEKVTIRKGGRQIRVYWTTGKSGRCRIMAFEQERAGTHRPFKYSESKQMVREARQYLVEGKL
jgi:hypothetical protein